MLLLFGKSVRIVGTCGGIWVMIQCVLLIATIPPTEKALKNNFDEKGNRR